MNYILEIRNYNIEMPCIVSRESLEAGVSPIEIVFQIYESKPNYQQMNEEYSKLCKWLEACYNSKEKEEYLETLIIKNLEEVWTLIEAHPISINFGCLDFNYSSTDDSDLNLTVSFSSIERNR